jgi:hypothetical protein
MSLKLMTSFIFLGLTLPTSAVPRTAGDATYAQRLAYQNAQQDARLGVMLAADHMRLFTMANPGHAHNRRIQISDNDLAFVFRIMASDPPSNTAINRQLRSQEAMSTLLPIPVWNPAQSQQIASHILPFLGPSMPTGEKEVALNLLHQLERRTNSRTTELGKWIPGAECRQAVMKLRSDSDATVAAKALRLCGEWNTSTYLLIHSPDGKYPYTFRGDTGDGIREWPGAE